MTEKGGNDRGILCRREIATSALGLLAMTEKEPPVKPGAKYKMDPCLRRDDRKRQG